MHLSNLTAGFWAWWTETWKQGWLLGTCRFNVRLQAVGDVLWVQSLHSLDKPCLLETKLLNFHINVIRKWTWTVDSMNSSRKLGRKWQVFRSFHPCSRRWADSSSWHGGYNCHPELIDHRHLSCRSLFLSRSWMSCWQLKPSSSKTEPFIYPSKSCQPPPPPINVDSYRPVSHRLIAVLSLLTPPSARFSEILLLFSVHHLWNMSAQLCLRGFSHVLRCPSISELRRIYTMCTALLIPCSYPCKYSPWSVGERTRKGIGNRIWLRGTQYFCCCGCRNTGLCITPDNEMSWVLHAFLQWWMLLNILA